MRRGDAVALSDDDVKLQMTAMIDVTFLLIIFFMCTTRFRTLEGRVEALLPSTGTPARKADEVPNVIHVGINAGAAGGVGLTLDGCPCAGFGALKETLDRTRRLIPHTKVVLDPAGDVPHDAVMQALDVCRDVGINAIAFRAPARRRGPSSASAACR